MPSPSSQPTGRNESSALIGRLQTLELELDRLLMLSEALWTLLRDQHGYTDEDLQQRLAEIDLRDGRLDGRVASSAPANCPHCGRTLAKRRPRCLYCGKPVLQNPFQR